MDFKYPGIITFSIRMAKSFDGDDYGLQIFQGNYLPYNNKFHVVLSSSFCRIIIVAHIPRVANIPGNLRSIC